MKRTLHIGVAAAVLVATFGVSTASSSTSVVNESVELAQVVDGKELKSIRQKESSKAYQKMLYLVEKEKLPFAGAYLDEEKYLNVGLVGEDISQYKNTIKKHIANDYLLKFHKMNHTYKDLKALQKSFRGKYAELGITGVGIRQKENKVIVYLQQLTDERKQTVVNSIPDGYPADAIIFEQASVKSTASRTDEHNPLIGGIQVSSGNSYGTLGFPAVHSDGSKGFVTVSHLVNGVGTTVYQGDFVGTTKIDPTGNRYSDAAFIKTEAAETLTGQVYGGYKISGILDKDLTPVGFDVAFHGVTSGIATGTIEDLDFDTTLEGAQIYDQVIMSQPSAAGDSGAPVLDRYAGEDGENNVLGIEWALIDGLFDDDAVYSPIGGIKGDTGVSRPIWWTETLSN